MFHSRIQKSAIAQGDGPIHPAWCGCLSCRRSDPIVHARARRILRIQACLIITLAIALYGTAILCAPGIAAAFGWTAQ